MATHEIFGLTPTLDNSAKNFEKFSSAGFFQIVPSSTIPGLIVPSQYPILGDCFHNMVFHIATPGFGFVWSRHNHHEYDDLHN